MHVLDVENVHARYGDHEVLRGVSLQVSRGQWFCLLGPNGVGKSTLLHCIAGRLEPSTGAVRISGHSSSAAAKRRLGYACSPDQLPELLTGRQCLEVYAMAKQLSAVDDEVLALAEGLRFRPFMDAFVDSYSLGTRQKLCVLLALLGEPDLIVLDEAFNGLDPRSALKLKQHLRARLLAGRCGLLLATHSLDIVEHYADAAALMIDGVIAKRWTEDEIGRLRSGEDQQGLESALAEASDVA
jgi:ABC-2 type transport system ATP-binding protein